MRTFNELLIEFSTWGSEEKPKWVDKLPIEELKTLRNGLEQSPSSYFNTWVGYIDLTISSKIKEERDRKLNELGI